ncbi:hypothetical protein PLESTM_001723800, partial [Pleodorina starrii]
MVRLATFNARNAKPRTEVDPGGPGGVAAAGPEPTETPEAQEARLVAQYQSALVSAAEGSTQQAVEGFQAMLRHPLLAAGPQGAAATRSTLRELRFLATRNLADQLGLLEEQQQQQQQQQQQEQQLVGASGDAGGPLAGPGWAEDGGAAGGSGSTTALRLQLYGEAIMQQYTDAQAAGSGTAGAAAAGDPVLWHRLADVALQDGRPGLARYALETGLAASGWRHVVLLEKLLQLQLRTDDVAGALASCRRLASLDPFHPWLQPAGGGGGGAAAAAARTLPSRLLRLVDPQKAALEEFLERQRLEQQYGYGHGYGPPYDGGQELDAAAAVAAAGLPQLEAPVLEDRLPEGLPAKRRRLTAEVAEVAEAASPGSDVIDLEVPVVAYSAQASPHPSSAEAAAATAATAVAVVDADAANPRQALYDSTAVLTSLNRLLRGLPPGLGAADAGGAAGAERLAGAVLRLAPASTG